MQKVQTGQQISTAATGQIPGNHFIVQCQNIFFPEALHLNILRLRCGKMVAVPSSALDQRGILNPGEQSDDCPYARCLR